MKNVYKIVAGLFAVLFMASCNDGIDPITYVDPGDDAGAPSVTIVYPVEGTQIQVYDAITSIDIKLKVEDDIEIATVKVLLDGAEINSFNEFIDYRIFSEEFTYDAIATGAHVLTVTATDIVGNTTSKSVNFVKAPPYTAMFNNEFFYMPFNDDYMELVSVTPASQVGNPGFAGTALAGSNAYKGAADSYLTFPFDGATVGAEFSAAFWYKVNATPDRAGLLVVGTDTPEDRTHGFRLFREGSGTSQRIKLNVGTGSGESWNDGGLIDVAAGEWVHVAFTVSNTGTVIYLNGSPVNTSTLSSPVSWTGTGDLTIGSGGPTFSYWNHLSDLSAMDELRFFDAALTQTDIQTMIDLTSPYEPMYDGETFYMPFNGSFAELVSSSQASEVGSPGFAGESYEGSDAYEGVADSYLTFPIDGVFGTQEFSAAFWYKVNASPDRAGILVVGVDEVDRFEGFRIFREGSSTSQRIKLNVGTGAGESWNDGGLIDPALGEWVHIAITVSSTESKIYFNGVLQLSATLSSPIDWTGCSEMVIGAGGPTFSYWNHLSDQSPMDELRLFNKALSQTEIQAMLN